MEEEACDYIVPSPTLKPAARIQIYNQQYWWRLLNALHDIYPLVTRLFGYYDFNMRLGIPYICRYPPNHWSLSHLGSRLPQWLKEEYQESDRELILNAAAIDNAFNDSFTSVDQKALSMDNLPVPNDPASIMDRPLFLQKHVHLFAMNYDLFDFRVEFLKQNPDYWIENDFPPLQKGRPYYFVLYRTLNNLINWKEISNAEYFLLSQLALGISVEAACDLLETQDEEIQKAAYQNLHRWFQEWTALRWLTLDTN